MMKFPRRFAIAALAACLMAGAAIATETPAPTQADAPPAVSLTPEQLSLQGFGLQSLSCQEWSDACSICLRDASGAMNCSTPGIACQPEAIVCRREKVR